MVNLILDQNDKISTIILNKYFFVHSLTKWLNQMIKSKIFIIGGLTFMLVNFGFAQDKLTITEAYRLAENNFPLLRSIDIYQAIAEMEDQLIDQKRKPVISIHSEATLQSEAVSIGTEIPNSPISIDVPLYRAQAYGKISYSLYDGGVSEIQKHINDLQTQVKQQEILIDAYPLKAQVNQLFFGILLGQNLTKLYQITESDLQARKEILQSGVQYGTVLESEVTKIAVRLMELENEKRKVAADINSGYATLSVLLGENVAPNTELVIDIEERFLTSTKLNRPESALYEKQRVSVRAQKELIDRMDKPQIILFGQAGLAYPNRLNFSKIELAPFALGGIGLSYKLSDKSDKSIKKQKLILHENLIDIREETFEHQLEVQKSGYAEKFQSLNYQIDQYEKIAELQAEILSQLQIQLDNGVITSTDYLIQANAELLARQNLELTKVRLKQKELEYFNIIGQKN